MGQKKEIARNLFEGHVKGSIKEAMVPLVTVFVCHITAATHRKLQISHPDAETKVYLSTRVLKHLYDKRTAEEFDTAVDFLHKILKYPERIYINKDPKRGHFAFVKNIHGRLFFCSVEIQEDNSLHVVTIFRVKKEQYLLEFELLWRWKDDTPSS